MELKLTADTDNEERVLDYLRGNVSESLAERINAGSKTLADCWMRYFQLKYNEEEGNTNE